MANNSLITMRQHPHIQAAFAIVAFTAILITAINLSLNRVEAAECHQWQNEPRTFSDWQIDQCTHHGIPIVPDAPQEATKRIDEPGERHVEIIDGTVTAFNSEPGQTDDRPFETAYQTQAREGIAACPSRYPFGTRVTIQGRTFTCEDRMAKRYRDTNRFDIWMATRAEAIAWGVQETKIIIKN